MCVCEWEEGSVLFPSPFMIRLLTFQEELAARIPEQHAALLDKKDLEDRSALMGTSRPEPEPPHIEVNELLV